MTPQAAKAWHSLGIAVGMGLATALETRFLTGLPDTVSAWRGLLNTCIAAGLVAGIGWWVRRQPTTPPNGPTAG